MRWGVAYDITIEMEYPLGESSDLAYDTWGRDVAKKVGDFTTRVVRDGPTLTIAMQVTASVPGDLTWAINILLNRIHGQAPGKLVVRVEDLDTPRQQQELIQEQL